MASISNQICSADQAICNNIASVGNRDLLSQNILSQLRNLIEGIIVFTHSANPEESFHYDKVSLAMEVVKQNGRLNFLAKFHKLIQKSASHYTFDGDTSERLMLKYYEYLLRTRKMMNVHYGLNILNNLEAFPIDQDPSLREYHERIADQINTSMVSNQQLLTPERYYIHKTRPFFVNEEIFYEVTFYRAINKATKADRVIAFTSIDITDKYSAMLTLQQDAITVIGYTMPIIIIRQWEVSIRPCEFDNLAKLLTISKKVQANSKEYRFIMNILTTESSNLLDIIDMPDNKYEVVKANATNGVVSPKLFPILDKARYIIRPKLAGHNIIRYLMLTMFNKTLKSQFDRGGCANLSALSLKYACIPFDQMPFCTSLSGHNPRYWDLVESLDTADKQHELLVRKVKNNVDHQGVLYTPVAELSQYDNLDTLIRTFNNNLYYKHRSTRKLISDKGHVFVAGYEIDTAAIVTKLKGKSSHGIQGYTEAVERWLSDSNRDIDDALKVTALKQLFCKSYVALIYGAAGTGKSTMVNHIANYFNDKQKLFLAHTNPAVDNLKRKVSAQNSVFRTISSQCYTAENTNYDVLIIDECSTVSNADLLSVLEKTSFDLLVLVGDIYQIESIQFGNWFSAISSFIPSDSIFELQTPYRTSKQSLLNFWNKVRSIDDDIAESIAQNDYSSVLNSKLFQPSANDEIILCLNYDGLYGINNVNRFMQSSNPNPVYTWRETIFKVGDPILFSETGRFTPVIYNNLKGRIKAIQQAPGWIQFDVWLDRPVSQFDVLHLNELTWISSSVVRFTVYDHPGTSDEDDDSYNTTIPFQVAYAVSIHKAQGLEYESVKIVITDANEDDVSHSIFYTAVTRARKHLKIFWTPETQQSVLNKLSKKTNTKDVHLLKARCGL
ncbi:ATP-dependent RecD-like DNA helicase [Colwellia sp. MSW7]|uniref:ATP-dependent RecD-like DNA helicase n=1 Tax=Colwellia maritima TaxID=2912588 RepID=A0ABS9X3B2_9GAMM|nr:AAA family ATPase [Colwellia maritima]MCI2284733.1 ATP-dependent RecD-like DNA helicase [Colwellia maritima]